MLRTMNWNARPSAAFGFRPASLRTGRQRPPRPYTVRLHFAELDNAEPGQRVFDVKLQDKAVLKDFDIVKEAGGARRAIVREFRHVSAQDVLTLELMPSTDTLTPATAPIVNGIEVLDERFDKGSVGR